MIRLFKEEDRAAVSELLLRNGLSEAPVGGYGLVWEEKVIHGFIWAFTDNVHAYIDCFAVDKEFRGEFSHTNCGVISTALMNAMILLLKKLDVKYLKGSCMDNPVGLKMANVYSKYGMKMYKSIYNLSGDIDEVMIKLMESYEQFTDTTNRVC